MDKNKKHNVKRLKRNELIAERERTKLMHRYKKMLRKEEKAATKSGDAKKILPKSNSGEANFDRQNETQRKETHFSSKLPNIGHNKKTYMSSYEKSLKEFENKQTEKQKKLEEIEKQKKEKEEALKKYKQSKKQRFKTLCKKSRSGQLLMGKQVENLLKKIEKSNNKS